MATTNFSALTSEQLTVWSRDVWRFARSNAFLNRFLGSGPGAMIQHITELTKSKKGARAVITLVADLQGDGVVGDRTLEGNEEPMTSYDQVIQIDQMRDGERHEGRMADQRSVVVFRENSRNTLAYWLSDRMDQLAFLVMSGISFANHTNGKARVGSDFPFLDFAADVKAPSANRHQRWDAATTSLVAGNTASVAAADTPTYNMLLQAKGYAKEHYIRPLRGEGGIEGYNVFMTPAGITKLKQDPNFQSAWRNALPRAKDNPLFAGSDVVYVDGLAIYDFRHVYNTKGLAAGSKWGAAGAVDGQRMLLCGAQAMGFADIGAPEWIEKGFDYENQQGISVAKILGMLKPQFKTNDTQTVEDFGVLAIDTAI